ncbi:MAG: Gram-negative bacterial tonB protein [Betaproteobacteria bacterium ADurb.Bin341]|nr:MAG: Gram-negative bacterial tonB protein [Betaproteobacteria bacterium ADurb.Bin341]
MTRINHRLLLAFLLSLAIHLLPFLPLRISRQAAPKPPPALSARLLPPALPAPAPILPPPETSPQPPQATPPETAQKENKPASSLRWERVIGQQMSTLKAQGKFYSAEAKKLGLEGDLVILMVLDKAGNVTAAHIEESSGHPLLDRDALNAVNNLRYLPADTPREVLLPLRFRLED